MHTLQMQKIMFIWRICEVSIPHIKAQFKLFKTVSFQEVIGSPF